jgi:GcrA cell cycle regulator
MSDAWALGLLPATRRPGQVGRVDTFSDEELRAIVEMRNDGFKWEAIGRAVNRPWKSCQRRYFLIQTSEPMAEPEPTPEPAKVDRLSEELGISTTTVWQAAIGSFGNVSKVPITLSMGVTGVAWTNEQDDLLRRCLEEKMTHGEAVQRINETFQTSYTRNASIGRAHRLDIDSLITASIAASRPRAPRVVKPTGPRIRPRSSERVTPLPKMRCVEIEPRHLAVTELEFGDCRYPYGGDIKGEPITFCGCQALEGKAYCAPHYALTRSSEQGRGGGRAAAEVRTRLYKRNVA